MKSLENGTYDDFCGLCGFALQKHQQAATFQAQGVDFSTHDNFVLKMTLCPECWEKVKQITAGGLGEAMARMVDLKLDDLGQSREREVKNRGYKANFKKDGNGDDDGGTPKQ